MISQNEISLYSSKRVQAHEAYNTNKSCHSNSSMNQSSAFKHYNYSQHIMNEEVENEDEDLMQNDKRRRLLITQQQPPLLLQSHHDEQSPKKRSRKETSNMFNSCVNGHDKDGKEENDEKTRKREGLYGKDHCSIAESSNCTILRIDNQNKKRRCESLILTSRTASPWTTSSSAATTTSTSSSTTAMTKLFELNSCQDQIETLATNSTPYEYYSSLEPWTNSTISTTIDSVTTPSAQQQHLLYRSHPHDSSMSSSEALSTTAEPSLSDRDEDEDNDECHYHDNCLHEDEAAEETDSIATELSQVVDHWSLDPEYDMPQCG